MIGRVFFAYLGACLLSAALLPVAMQWTMGGHSIFYVVLIGTPTGIAVALGYADLRKGLSVSDAAGRSAVAFLTSIVGALAALRIMDLNKFLATKGWLLIPVMIPPLAAYLSQVLWKEGKK